MVLPGEYHYLPLYIVGEGHVSGTFSQAQSQLISLCFLTQQQYDSYRSTGALNTLLTVSNVPSGTYDTQIASPGNYYLLIFHGTGFDQISQGVTIHIITDGTNPPYLDFEGITLVGIVMVSVGGLVRRRETKRQILSLITANPNYGFGQSEEDGRILQVAKELCYNLRIAIDPIAVYYVVWLKFEGIRKYPSDQCSLGAKGLRRGWLHLPASLRGQLSPTEWKPLIASSLIHEFDPKIRRKLRFRYVVAPLAFSITGLVLILATRLFYTTFPEATSAAERFLLLQFPLVLLPLAAGVFFSMRKWNVRVRKYFLQADSLAAGIVGKAEMVQTLSKIDSMALPDIEERKQITPSVWSAGKALPWPSISERIQRLQEMQNRSSAV